jgi:hypothetical protein
VTEAEASPTGGRAHRRPSGRVGIFDTLLDYLVEGFVGGLLQPLDLILDHQLAALQLDNLQVVCGKVHERFVQFVLEDLVFTFKFNKMRL